MTERRVVIDIEPRRWRGSPWYVWVLAAEAWFFVALMLVVTIVGGDRP